MKIGWTKARLEDLTEQKSPITYGVVKPGEEGSVRFVRGGDIADGRVLVDQLRTITIAVSEQYSRTLLRGGELLMCLVGQPGQVAIAPENLAGANIARQVGLIRLRSEFNAEFIKYFLQSPDGQASLGAHTGGSVQQVINLADLRTVEIPLPSPTEQHRIVALLDEAFDGIATAKANAEKTLQNARALFESVLDSVQGEDAPLGGNVIIKTGKLDANAATENGAYPFFTCAKEIYAIDDYAFDCEAILLAGNNAVGDFNVKHYKGKFNAYQRTYVITVVDESLLSYRFLYFQMLKSLRHFKKQSVGAGTKFLKLGMIKDLKISLPPIAKQIETASLLDFLLEETQHLESLYQQKITALDELKQSLLHQAFSGKL